MQGDHLSGKPGNARDFNSCPGYVRDFTKSRGSVRKKLVGEKWPKTVLLVAYFQLYRYLEASS